MDKNNVLLMGGKYNGEKLRIPSDLQVLCLPIRFPTGFGMRNSQITDSPSMRHTYHRGSKTLFLSNDGMMNNDIYER
jgi:hypothetical protein